MLHLVNVGSGQNTLKTVAIILGGAAGVGFLVICLLFARNLMKKHDGKYVICVPLFGFIIALLSYSIVWL